MAKWEDLPGELHAEIWGHFRNNVITSLLHVDNEPFETYVAECTAKLGEEERRREEERRDQVCTTPYERRQSIRSGKRYDALRKAQAIEKASDRLAVEHAVLISKELAWSLRGELEDRLKAMIKVGKTIHSKYIGLRYGSWYGEKTEKEAYGRWQSEISLRIQRIEEVVNRVNTWRLFRPCWQSLPLEISTRIVGEAMKNCTVSEDTWEQIDRGKYGFDAHANVDDEVREDLRKRIFRLSIVSKSVAVSVSKALEGLLVHLEEQKQIQQYNVYGADEAFCDAEYDTTGSKSAACGRAEYWLEDLTTLHNHAYKLRSVVSSWTTTENELMNFPRRLKAQIARENLRAPKLKILKELLRRDRSRNIDHWGYNRYEESRTKNEFEPCHEGLEKLWLLARCYPTAWLVKRLRRYSAKLLGLSNTMRKILSTTRHDQGHVDLRWPERTEALRDEVEALLSKVYTWAAESW